MESPSLIAYLALLSCFPIAMLLFGVLRAREATTLLFLMGALLLPGGVAFDAPGIPPLGREAIPALCAFLGCLLSARNTLRSRMPITGLDCLVLGLVLGAPLTAITNGDPISTGGVVRPALTQYDVVSTAANVLLTYWIPFYLGRVLVRRPGELRSLLMLVVAAGLVYSVPILYELRMSPVLHHMVYGIHAGPYQTGLMQRWGGWRPRVFMVHGLSLALFMLATVLGAVGLWRARVRFRPIPASIAGIYLTVLLVLCKGLATLTYAVAVVPLALVARPRVQLVIAAVLTLLVFAYPLLRATDLFPTELMVDTARVVSDDRAQSLNFRLINEDELLERAQHRIWFGWGGYGRSRVYDPVTGRDLSITDGFWIIILGQSGVLGLASAMGLLLAPVLLAAFSLHYIRGRGDRFLVSTTALIVMVRGVDLLPNALLAPIWIFISGGLAGAVEGARRRPSGSRPQPMHAAERDSDEQSRS